MSALARIKSALGFSSKAASKKINGRVIPDLSLWLQFQRVGGGLTPQQVSGIIREADAGQTWRLMDLANDARQKDCHLQSVLATSEEAIAGLEWELELPENPKLKERKAAEALEDHLRSTGLMPRLFAHHAGARYYGYAVTEPGYERVGELLLPTSFDHISARRFGFRINDGVFVWRDMDMPYDGVDIRKDYPNKFIISQPRITGDVPCREGLVRVLMWAALFRNWTLTDWLKLGEIAWKPWRTGTYDKDADQKDIDNLTDVLEGMSSNGVAVVPTTTNLKVEWPAGMTGQSQHGAMFAAMAAEMSKAVLGQTLTTEQGKVGSQALGNVQNEVRKDLREATARYVAGDITRDLIAPLTAMNWGPGVRPARLRLITDDAKDLVAFSTALDKLTGPNVKLSLPAKWVRKQAGVPDPDEDEEMIGFKDGEVDIPIDPKTGLPSEPRRQASAAS